MQIREILATYLAKAIKPLDEDTAEGAQAGTKQPLALAKARADLPPPALDILLSEYRIACEHKADFDINAGLFNFIPAPYVEQIIQQLKSPKAPFKDARTRVTFYPESGTARVVFESQGAAFGDTIVKSGEELWKLLKRAATDGLDVPAPKPIPYFIESQDEWLKTHRPTRAVQKKMFSEGQVNLPKVDKATTKKYSMAFEEIMNLNLKL
jgi:hypothetical protein